MTANTIYTIGHSTRSVAELVALLREAAVGLLVDVRSVPRSRTNPQFNTGTLPQDLNTLWRSDPFRNYADYAMTEPFREGLAELRGHAEDHVCAIMCAEAVWWRCHRRIVADYLLAEGADVRHIMGHGKIEPARLTAGALPQADRTIRYSGEPVGSLL